MDASLPRVMGMETCWLITLVPPEKIFAMRSGRHEAQFRIGRNIALICGAKFCIAQPKCWKGAASNANALAPLTFSEIIATSDLPPGVFNLLAGDRNELAPHFASHMDVNAIVDASGDDKIGEELQAGSAINVKRYVRRGVANYFVRDEENPYWILDTVEMKTAWHPIGL